MRRALLMLVLAATIPGCTGRTPDLAAVPSLLSERRFEEVEGLLEAFLREHPEDDRSHVLAAQVALARPDQKPRLALDHLDQVGLLDRASRAIVRLNQGKAYSSLLDYRRAEVAWLEALLLDPKVPEAGWALLGLYYVQGRREEARRLGLKLHATEPDPRDRVQLLLELVRQDAQPLSPAALARALEPAAREHPDDLRTNLALGRALVRSGQIEPGLMILRRAAADHPRDVNAWDALMSGLDDAGLFDELSARLPSWPEGLRTSPRFQRHRGRVLQEVHDWASAVEAYLRAWQHDPSDPELTYRLCRAARLAGRDEEAVIFDQKAGAMRSAQARILELYTAANSRMAQDARAGAELCHRLAELREQMGLPEEAAAWDRIAGSLRIPRRED